MSAWFDELHHVSLTPPMLRWWRQRRGLPLATVWKECTRAEWLVWILQRHGSTEQIRRVGKHLQSVARQLWPIPGEQPWASPVLARWVEVLGEEDQLSAQSYHFLAALVVSGYELRLAEQTLLEAVRTACPDPPALLVALEGPLPDLLAVPCLEPGEAFP